MNANTTIPNGDIILILFLLVQKLKYQSRQGNNVLQIAQHAVYESKNQHSSRFSLPGGEPRVDSGLKTGPLLIRGTDTGKNTSATASLSD